MESLSPVTLLEPEASITHVKQWELVKGVEISSNDGKNIEVVVKKYIIKEV